MKKITNQFNESHVDRMNYGGAKFYRFALFPLMLLMLLFVPTRMVAQTDYDTSVTFSALAGSPEGMSEAENFKKLFDGKKTEGNSSKWCCSFYGRAYVIFEASKAGVPVGYTITTGNDNETWGGRNPLSWKLYGNNTGSDDAWELIDEVSDDKVLKDKNYTSYDFTCKCSTSYQYFKWEISAIHSGRTLQVGEFKLKLQTCSHKNTDGSDALGDVIKNVEPTCTEHGYTTQECSLCNSIVKVYKDDVLKPHTLTHHEAKAATCTEAGNIEYWQCSVCNKLFSDEAATKEITDATSLVIPAKGHTFDREGNCTVCHYKDSRYALFNLEGITDVTITDNDSYPWKMLDLNADGMSNVSSYFTAESKGLMSSNYGANDSSSKIEVKFNVEKPILFSFKYLISAMNSNYVFITLNGKRLGDINGTEQKVYKSILDKGEYTLKLSYNTYPFDEGNKGADRAFIYDLNTATTISDYVAELDATNTTLTFKKITSDNLESIDLSRLVIVNDEPMVKDMYDIETIKIKNIVFDESFKTYAPTALYSFFKDLTELETIKDLKYLNTANVKYMSDMFWDCKKLSSLDLSKFNTEKVTDMSGMFHGCQKLSSLDLSKFNTEKVEGMISMFEDCKNLSSLDLSKFNTEKVTDMRGMFCGCQNLSSLDLSNFNTANVMEMGNMFYNCSTLTSLDLSNFNTEKVESMMGMFFSCSALTSLDLSNFNTKKVRYMNSMFNACSALTTIYAGDKFVTTKVENGSYMFSGCTNLKGFDSSMIDHKKANCGTDGYFTPGCAYAEFDNATLTFRYKGVKPAGAYDLNVESNNPGWDAQRANIKKVVFDASFANARPTSCCLWFADCFYLTEIEGIENLNTEKVTNMVSMFSGCYALTSLDVSNFNTQNVEDMSLMFEYCSALSSLDLSKFNTANVKNMEDMFKECRKLSLLDLSNFNTERVKDMSSMFSGCSTLQTIFASDKFVTDQVFYGVGMFFDCKNLKGFIDYISNTDKDKDDNKYANYKTGYFTKLVGKNGEEKIGATGVTLTTENLVLDDGKDFVAYEPFAAKDASYSRKIKEGSTWGTLCLPFAIVQSQETECKFYRLTGIDNDNDCITLESCEEGIIPAGTPVLFKMNENEQTLSISVQNVGIVIEPVDGTNVTEPVAGTASDVYLVGSFTKIGGKDNQGLAEYDYIIGKDKFWRVSDLDDGNGVGIKPMRAYIHPANEYLARAAMLSIGKGDGTTAIDNLNAISNDANAEYYDANGRRTNGLQKGLNIVKRGSKTYKIMVK